MTNATSPTPASYDRTLLQLGVILFLFGLATGFVVPLLAIPRLGLASHLEGVMNGIVLMVLGLMWPRLKLGAGLQRLTFLLAVYAAIANWAATLFAAATRAAAMMPIAGGGATADATAEAIVAFLLITLSIAMITAFLLVLWGLRRG